MLNSTTAGDKILVGFQATSHLETNPIRRNPREIDCSWPHNTPSIIRKVETEKTLAGEERGTLRWNRHWGGFAKRQGSSDSYLVMKKKQNSRAHLRAYSYSCGLFLSKMIFSIAMLKINIFLHSCCYAVLLGEFLAWLKQGCLIMSWSPTIPSI